MCVVFVFCIIEQLLGFIQFEAAIDARKIANKNEWHVMKWQ